MLTYSCADEFAVLSGLDPNSAFNKHMFHLLDPDGQGAFDFRTLVQGLILVNGTVGEDEKLELVFQMYDTNQDGTVSEAELISMLERTPPIRDSQTGLYRSSSSEVSKDIATQVLEGQATLTLDEFKQRCASHPEILSSAIGRLAQWMEGVVQISVETEPRTEPRGVSDVKPKLPSTPVG